MLDVPVPLVAAPMAGGPSSPELVAAVGAAGALPMVAGGYLSPEALSERIGAARAAGHPFGVNLFVPGRSGRDAHRVRAYAEHLGIDPIPERALAEDDDAYPGKLALLLEDPVPLVSFTFALPPAEDIARLRAAGSVALVTVTTPQEARTAVDAGADGLVVQGPRAGGHSGTWDPDRHLEDAATADVVRAVRAEVDVPLIAAGGVDGAEAVRELLLAGAESVALGTLLLRSEEAGTSPSHRAALADPRFTGTALTRAFTGRPARSLRNRFVDQHEEHAISAYPAVHHLTRERRAEAGRSGDAESLHLWAGTGWRAAQARGAGQILREIGAAL